MTPNYFAIIGGAWLVIVIVFIVMWVRTSERRWREQMARERFARRLLIEERIRQLRESPRRPMARTASQPAPSRSRTASQPTPSRPRRRDEDTVIWTPPPMFDSPRTDYDPPAPAPSSFDGGGGSFGGGGASGGWDSSSSGSGSD